MLLIGGPDIVAQMVSRWRDGIGAAVVVLVACVLVILDSADAGLRRWWDAHALTTDTVAGLLVLMITFLVADQVVRHRQSKNRSNAVAVQVAIMMVQAIRASQAVFQVLDGSGDAEAASEEFRTYTMMLLAVAPVLIDDRTSRTFLERAQHLDGEMARALTVLASSSGAGKASTARLDEAVAALKFASVPLLQSLDPEVRSAVRGEDLV